MEATNIKNAVALELYRVMQSKPEKDWKGILTEFNSMVYNNLSDQMKELDEQREELLTIMQSIKQ